MLGENDAFYAQERRKDMHRAVEQARLIRLARLSRPQRARLHRQALSRLGRWLVVWGSRLQRRYGAAEPAPTYRPARQTR